jgi:hypothetical protein
MNHAYCAGEIFRLTVVAMPGGKAGMAANVPEETQELTVNVIVQAIDEMIKQKLPHGSRLASMIIVISEQLQRGNPGLAAQVRKMNIEYQKTKTNDTLGH